MLVARPRERGGELRRAGIDCGELGHDSDGKGEGVGPPEDSQKAPVWLAGPCLPPPLADNGRVRVYVRHPSAFPVELRQGGGGASGSGVLRERLRDLSTGGLCCRSSTPFEEGERVRVRIPVGDPGFEGEGRVAWCRPQDDGYRVGIEFVGEGEAFRARMVEQVCHIELYHRQLRAEGRELSEEDAALEWVSKYAARFPR